MNEKDGYYLVQWLVNMVDNIEQTRQNPIFFPAWFLLNLSLHYYREVLHLIYWCVLSIFLEHFHAPVTAVEGIILHWVIDYSLKTQNASHTVITFLPQSFVFVSPLSFVLITVIKDPFFITCKDILEKQVISLPWKKSCEWWICNFSYSSY